MRIPSRFRGPRNRKRQTNRDEKGLFNLGQEFDFQDSELEENGSFKEHESKKKYLHRMAHKDDARRSKAFSFIVGKIDFRKSRLSTLYM